MNDIADGVAAGKVDHKKTDADVRDITKAVEATVPAIQDAVTRLYKTLDATQRKTLVASMREHSEDMHEHGMMGPHGMGGHEHGEHGMMGGHEQGGPPAPPGPVMGRGPATGAPPAQGGPAGLGAPPQGGLAGGPAGPSAAPPPAQGGPGAPGMGGGPRPGMNAPAGGMGDHHAHEHGSMFEKLSTELALTPEQQDKLRTKVEAQMKAQEATMKARKAASEKHMKQIGDAFEGEKFDAKKVGVGQRAPEMAKTMATTHIAFVETVLAVLTPEQRVKFAAHIRDHAADPG
jgi:Spy/CpxP family protein refolding chaperone